MRLRRVGERARLIELDAVPRAERSRRTLAAARAVARRWPALDVVPGAGEILLDGIDRLAPGPDEALAAQLARLLAAIDEQAPADAPPAVTVATIYDGPDLADVARAIGATPGEVVRLHTGPVYTVELLGFLPGFAYLGPVVGPLALPRRSNPRPVVPARSVAVAAGFTGVYPSATPGGWHLLGHAPDFAPFSPDGQATFLPGAEVRFVALEGPSPAAADGPSPLLGAEGESRRPGGSQEPQERRAASGSRRPGGPAMLGRKRPAQRVRLLRVPPGASVQDAGRRGRLGQGLPPSGPLDEALAAAANVAAGNAPGEAAIEVPLGPLEVEAQGVLWVSVDGRPRQRLRDGERLVVAPRERAVAYLAVAGGIDTEPVQGSRAVLVAAGLGGRALRPGDTLPVGDRAVSGAGYSASIQRVVVPPAPPEPAELLFVPGPHLDRFPARALDRLTEAVFTVSALGNRVGVRLDGARVPVGAGRLDVPSPMVRGAIEVATDGTPIVLGPDHPVTGGYPVIGVLTRSAQGKLARLWPGQRVRLVAAG